MKQKPEPPMDEQLVQIIERGAIAPVRLHPLDYPAAISLRMKLYRTRKRLLTTNVSHPARRAAELISIKLYPKEKAFELLVHPKNMGYEEAFLNAGLFQPKDEPPPLD